MNGRQFVPAAASSLRMAWPCEWLPISRLQCCFNACRSAGPWVCPSKTCQQLRTDGDDWTWHAGNQPLPSTISPSYDSQRCVTRQAIASTTHALLTATKIYMARGETVVAASAHYLSIASEHTWLSDSYLLCQAVV